MEWQKNGELSATDFHALLTALQRVEVDERSSELGRLSRANKPLN